MHPSKALGSNDMPPLFYQRYWYIVGPKITKAILEDQNTGQFSPELNHTFITLISKREHPSIVINFCPISLYNVLYKLIPKVIANRLKHVIPLLIYESLSTFVPER